MVLIPFVNSCTNLDEKFYDTVPVSNFGKTQAEQDALVGSVFPGLQKYSFNDPSYLSLVEISGFCGVIPRRGGDWWDNGSHHELTMHSWAPQSAMDGYGYLGIWYDAFGNIATCNQQIATIQKSSGDPSISKKTIAELRGMRTFWYYLLIDNFGNVPIITNFYDLTLPSTTVPGQRKGIFAKRGLLSGGEEAH